MRSLSSTLLAAQKKASHTPYVMVEARNTIAGVLRLDWTRLYTGTEDDHHHAVTIPGDGSLIRVRTTPPADSRKLYRQRVASPGPSSDFSQWVYTSQYNVVVTAAASLDSEVSIFWIKSDRAIYQLKSADYGATWGSPLLLGYSPTTAINGIAAAYKPGGDIALFFADQATLYVMKRTGGVWGSGVAWDKSTGDLSGAACVYDGDWKLLVTGKDSNGNFKLWSLIYGDGGEVSSGGWSNLRELASAPSDGSFEYKSCFLDKPDVYRGFFVEKFTGTQAYNRPFWSHSVADSAFAESLWREPVPFDLSAEYGMAIAHHDGYCWLSTPYGVWRASLTQESIELTDDVLSLRQELRESDGRLTAELRNDDGRYASPGQGALSALDIGSEIYFSPGYVTSQGKESSAGQTYLLEAYQHTSSAGKASLFLYASDALARLRRWTARHQFRWNKTSDDTCVKDILAFVFSRAGIKLEVKSQSAVITGFYPDFTVHPGSRGVEIIEKLLSFVPDTVFTEGNKAYLVNPQSSDSSVYSYGATHPVFDGSYKNEAREINRVQVEGYNSLLVEIFDWDEIGKLYDRLKQMEDRNLDTAAEAQQRGEAWLRKAEIASADDSIRIPVNCGQQLYDVIDITDRRAGLNGVKRRVLGLVLTYNTRRGEYEERLSLGAV